MGKTEIKYLSLSQEDLIAGGAFDLVLAREALEEGLFKFKEGRILFPDKIVQIFNCTHVYHTFPRQLPYPVILSCTMQIINKKIRPEIGYHFNINFHNKGYATEAAQAVKEYIFKNTTFKELYTYTTKENLPSRRVAEKNGMTFVEEYIDGNEHLVVYKISK